MTTEKEKKFAIYRKLLKRKNMVSEEEKENNLMMLRKNYSGHYNLKQESEIEMGCFETWNHTSGHIC